MSVVIQGVTLDVGDDFLATLGTDTTIRQVGVAALAPSNAYIKLECQAGLFRWWPVGTGFPLTIVEKL